MKVMTITGIRPDFIRMAEVFRRFDEEFDHTLVHSGQHYDKMLSGVFFDELDIRAPDYNLNTGQDNLPWEQCAELILKAVKLAKRINPDLIVFLGDSNSVTVSLHLKKAGFKIAHIEAGMRSYDKRMQEEINRVVCDHCSDLLFVYHQDYYDQAVKENIPRRSIHVVGNTIVEIYNKFGRPPPESEGPASRRDHILMDIHRPENFLDKGRLARILEFGCHSAHKFGLPIKMLKFKRTMQALKEYGLDSGRIEYVDLMSYLQFLDAQYHACFMISDSGTAQEEPALFNTPVLVPRDFTERPQSLEYDNSLLVDVNPARDRQQTVLAKWNDIWAWVRRVNADTDAGNDMDTSWLGDGTTSQKIVDIIKEWKNIQIQQ